MSHKTEDLLTIEPERYELTNSPVYPSIPLSRLGINRRQFFKRLGGGVAVFLVLRPGEIFAQRQPEQGRGAWREPLPQNLGAWLHIAESGAVTVYTGKAEMGQNIRTSLSQAVAEELHAALDSIRLVMADTELTPFDLGTFGSRTTPTMGLQLRRVASVARDMLIALAAKQWGVNPKALEAVNGEVRDPETGRSIKYGDLARGQELAKAIVEADPLTPPSQWTIAGKSVPRINGVEFVTGAHRFSPDIKRPGMLYAKLLRPPSFGAEFSFVDVRDAQAEPGVTVIAGNDFVSVAAPTEQAAMRALQKVRAQWKTTPQISSRDLFRYLKENAAEESGHDDNFARTLQSIQSSLDAADHRLEQTYTVAYIAHAPLETRAAVAEWENGKMTVWTGTQRPFAVRDEVAQALDLPKESVRVIVPDTGGAFGGKHTGEAAVEAARLARAAGRPVKLVWTREEEFTWAYFRPAGVIEIRSGARKDGKLTAWEFHNYNSGAAGIRTPYEVSTERIEFHPCRAPLRQGSYRCLAATANHFARESNMDDLARLVGLDPLEFRRRNLENQRLLAVLEASARSFGWSDRKRSPGRGFGLACGTEKGGYVATCAEVQADRSGGTVKVVRVVTAFDCGAIVNPEGLKNQIQGATMMGLGGALFEAIEFENGRILNNRFSRYRVPRFSDMPRIEVALVDRKDQPSAGAGEAPIMCVAPAIRNAILDATGIRLFSLPMIPHGLKV